MSVNLTKLSLNSCNCLSDFETDTYLVLYVLVGTSKSFHFRKNVMHMEHC